MVLEVRRDVGIWAAEDLSRGTPARAPWQGASTLDIGRLTATRPTPDLDGIICPFHCDNSAVCVEAITISISAFVVDTATSGIRTSSRAVVIAVCGKEFPGHGV